MNVARFTARDALAAADASAKHILSLLESTLADREFATLAVSGGAGPRPMFLNLAASRFEWSRVHLFWVDERCVPPTDPASNYKLVNESLITPAHFPAANVHRIKGEIDPKTAAAEYTADIRKFFGLTADAFPQFDVMHRGIGPDAHTASLFPGNPLVNDHEGIVGATFAPQFNQWRVTLLPAVLAAAHHTVLLVTGEEKQEAVRNVFQEEYNPLKYPAQIAPPQNRGVTWFLDDKAAALLD